jgi:membrane protein DedA with SNARE-associated domain
MAGTSRTPRLRFLAFDTFGAALYSVAYAGLGYVFSHDLARAAGYAGRVGTLFLGIAFAGFSIFAASKLIRRYLFARESRCADHTG